MAIFLKAQKFIAEEEYLKAEEYFNKIKFYLPAVIYLRILEIPKNVENLEHVKDIIKFIRENVDKDYEHKFDITKGDIYSTTAAFLMNNGMSYLSVDFLKEAIKIEDETDQDEFIIPAYKQKNKESPTMIFNYQMLGFIYDDLGDFIKSEELQHFYMAELNPLLENYEPGNISYKQDVLNEIKRRDEERAKNSTQQVTIKNNDGTSRILNTNEIIEALRSKIEENMFLQKELEKKNKQINDLINIVNLKKKLNQISLSKI
jgi:hypothetical protein